MSLSLLLILQAAAAAPVRDSAGGEAQVSRIDFDLRALAGARGCSAGEPADILVCGRRRAAPDYPIEAAERMFRTEPLVAEIRLSGNFRGDVQVESVQLDRGAVSRRAMVRVRIPF